MRISESGLKRIIRKALLERVVYAPVEGVPDEMGWYSQQLSDTEQFEKYAHHVNMLGVEVTVVFVPGREKPHSLEMQVYDAGSVLTADDILSDRVPVRGPEEELVDIYGGEETRSPRVNPVTGKRTKFMAVPPIPAQIPSGRERAVAEKIAEIVGHADTDGITLIMPQRAGTARDASPGWFVHDLGHALGLEGPNFKEIFRPLTGMGEDGLKALESLRAADPTATTSASHNLAFDYGPQALVNMVFRGNGKRVVLDGQESNARIKTIAANMTREIKRRLDSSLGAVFVWN